MQKLSLNELRNRFLNFFEKKEHLKLPSFPLVPQNDSSLLLINSGMAPLKSYFTGKVQPPSKRVTTCQKCIRTPDIENVGKTSRHGTFFEMLGNFSFGDYFKKEAIAFAWEFITKDIKLPEDKLWISIYQDDDDAFNIWTKDIGVSENKIVRMGKKDNFWEIGTGPCGPCSEIYYDRGEAAGCGAPDCKVGCDCDRYVEFWNLVFTQFSKDEEGNYTNLKHPNIDTGMGLERLACIMQEVNSLFEVDTVRNILNHICNIAKVEYGKNPKTDISIRVITDHIRSTTMMVSDGILPSNEGRGYVLRRLLRRAARHGKLLSINGQFLFDVAKVVINESKNAYPELLEKQDYITKVIQIEEERFETTIDQGIAILNEYIEQTKAKNSNILSGALVFKLHDTYGFPFELTKEISLESGLEIDEDGFKKEMDEQKKKAREALKNKESLGWNEKAYSIIPQNIKTEFVGYEKMQCEAKVLLIISQDKVVDSASEGELITALLDKTPFYAKSGGQVEDIGYIKHDLGKMRVENCIKTPDGKFLHIGVIEEGILETSSLVNASIDSKRRIAIARNHTTTHILQKALRKVLGEHVRQAGSLVEDDRLRFDFNHFFALTSQELKEVEREVNKKILENCIVDIKEMSIEEAKKIGATALFGEKYGNKVRVVSIGGNYSIELCGGTHLPYTSIAGVFKIISESGVAAGVRRIEALTGESSLKYINTKDEILDEISNLLKTNQLESAKKVESLLSELRSSTKEIEKLKNSIAKNHIEDILSKIKKVGDNNIIIEKFDNIEIEDLRNMADIIKSKLQNAVVVLASSYQDKVNFIASATKDLVSKGIHSGNIVREISKIAGGGGGGRPDMAQAGGKDIDKIDEALKHAFDIIKTQIKS